MIYIIDLIGRIFVSGIFLLSGFNKINNYEGTINWMSGYGLPDFLLIPAIFLEIIAPIMIIIGYKTKIAAGALSIFCIATALIFHNNFEDQMQIIAFMKNLALAGGLLFLFVNGPKGYCLDKK
tara:strand:- start:143 stop:511 length:369 start_codon:yes stop_codon:yes gene_type:complete